MIACRIAEANSTLTSDLLVAVTGALVAVVLTYGASWLQARRAERARRRKLLRLLGKELEAAADEAQEQAKQKAAVVARPAALQTAAWRLLVSSGVAAELDEDLLEALTAHYRVVERINHLRGAHDYLVLISQVAPDEADRESALDALTRTPPEMEDAATTARELAARVGGAARDA